MLVHVVADFGQGDLAFAEVAQRLLLEVPGAQLVYTPVPAFATLAAGFCAAQLALNPGPAPMAVFQNVAPRRDDPAARHDNAGERLVWARLPGGTMVVGPNSGHAFSFLAPQAAEMRFVEVAAAGSQFRSRDIFAGAFGRLVAGDESLLGEHLPAEAVPPPPHSAVAYVDGFGNIKTTVASVEAQPGSRVLVRIGEHEREATVAGGGFAVPDGQLAFSPGSSGWPDGSGQRVRFRELFLRGGSAAQLFGNPAPGTAVELKIRSAV